MDLSTVVFLLLLFLTSYLYIKDVYLRFQPEFYAILNYPGSNITPLVGEMFAVIMMGPEDLFQFGRKTAEKCKESWRQRFFDRVNLNAIRAREVEKVLSSIKHINKSLIYHFLVPFMGEGLLTSQGAKWQARRKILTPAFHFNILQQFLCIFQEESEKMAKNLEVEIDHPEGTDIIPICTQFAINSVCETAMGVKLDSIEEGTKYREKLYEMTEVLLYRLLRPWLYPDIIYNNTAHRKTLDKLLVPIHKFTKNIINQRRDQFNKNILNNNNVQDTGDENIYETKKRRYAMLDILLAAESDGLIDHEGIREEVDTFMFEGHDTTSAAIIFTFLLLAHNFDIQDQVVEEAKQVLGNMEDISTKEFGNLKFLDRVIKESLRLYPPVSFISRDLGEDMIINNVLFYKGSIVHIHIFDLHRDPEVFPDPEKFDPDRFLPENCILRHPYAYVPFSAGPRNCVGQKFAILEMKSIITKILMKYELHPITRREDIVFSADLVLRSKNPIKIKFKLREDGLTSK